MGDPNKTYWDEYTNLQHTKHRLIHEYLNGWFPKLGSCCGRILYVDTHAGRGKYTQGQEGSPLIAIKTFLEHRWRDKILKNCEVRFLFIEADEENTDNLQKEIAKLGKLPQNMFYDIHNQNAFKLLNDIADDLEKTGSNLAPCFMFIDPYGFKVPCSILKRIKKHSRSELLITLIWRELDMAMQQTSPPTELLDSVFGGNEWRNISPIDDFDARSEAAIKLLKVKIGAKWKTDIRMLGDNQKTRYLLLHLTDHEAGRDLMKDVAWKCCPDSGY
jgi:three-Cys-motif partner protein